MRDVRFCVWAVLGLVAGACSDDVTTKPQPAAADSAGAPDAAGVNDGTADAAEVPFDVAVDAATDVPDVQPDVSAPAYPPCSKNDDCPSGWCVPAPGGSVCVPTCANDGGCQKEFECSAIAVGSDQVFVCAHPAPFKCAPCSTDADCNPKGAKKKGICVAQGDNFVCAQVCGGSDACVGDDVTCGQAPGRSEQACLPTSGVCPCPDGLSGACSLKNEFGTCKGSQSCSNNAAGVCKGSAPAAESCNAIDDNCNGQTDEGVPTVACPITNKYGTCQGQTQCIGGQSLCQGAGAAPEVCNGIDDDCNGATDDGFSDIDGDLAADCTDTDDDGDGVPDAKDNCPLAANASQTDTDGDGKGDACGNDADGDGDPNASDCAPLDPKISKLAKELCTDQLDNDCNGQTDEAGCQGCTLYFDDQDGDSYGVDGQKACLGKPTDSFTADKGGDCNDTSAAVSPGAKESCNDADDNCNGKTDEENAEGCATFYGDADNDGYGAGTPKCLCAAAGVFTAKQAGDCNDKDPAVSPGAAEVCGNGQDDNCNGSENDLNANDCVKFFADVDGDGWGTGDAQCLCAPQGKFTAKQGGDCADGDPGANPALQEKCSDNKDNDCNGEVDEAGCQGCTTFFKDADQDNYGLSADKLCLGSPKYPYTAFVGGDCDDGTANVKPGGTEVCNGVDDNCDSEVDPMGAGGCSNFYPDADADGYGANVGASCLCQAKGVLTANKSGDCNDNDAEVRPLQAELCNGVDDNCNGQVDEGAQTTFYKDNDGDGYGSVTSQQACKAPAGFTAVAGDCNDFNKAIHPGADEVCNDVDDNCNGFLDDGLPLANIFADVDGDGFGGKNAKAKQKCLAPGNVPPLGYALSQDDCDDSKSTVYPGAPELCDGILNNCQQAIADAHCPKKCEGSWPVFVGGSSGFPAIAQLDGDNALEVVSRNEGHVRAFKSNGAVMWDTPTSVSYSYPALADMNNDSTVDVVVSTHGGPVRILNGNTGAELASVAGNAAGYYGATVFDFDRDGVNDIIPTGPGPYKLLLMKADLTVKSSISLNTLGEPFWLASAGAYDLTGSGTPSIFLGSGSWGCASDLNTCKGKLYQYDLAGNVLNDPNWQDAGKPWFEVKGYPQTYAGEGVWPMLLDVDGDGVTEIHHSFANSSSSLWQKNGSAHALTGKDGLGSFPMAAPVTSAWKLDPSGKLAAVSGPVVDIDGDGDYEQIANAGGGLSVLKAGKVMDGYPIKLSADPVVVGDINRDGQLDLVFTSGSNNALNCYTLGADTYADSRVLMPGSTHGMGRSHYPTLGYDPFEPNDIRTAPFDPKTSKSPVYDSRAFRISALRDVFSSGGGWTHKLQAVLGDKGDRDFYVLYGGIAYVTLAPTVRDFDLYLHVYKSDGTYLETRQSTGNGTATDSVMCHSTNNCPAGAGIFLIEVRPKDPNKDFGPWPYWLYTNWAQ